MLLKNSLYDLDWSHTFKDGEKAKLKVNPGMLPGGSEVSDDSLFIKVGLQKMNGSNLNYTVSKISNTRKIVSPGY